MQETGMVVQSRAGAVPAKRLKLRMCWMILLGAAMLCLPSANAGAAKAAASKPASAATKASTQSGFVGAKVCATCHVAEAKELTTNPHFKMTEMYGSNGMTCENCHGPGKAHVESGGDISKIFDPAKAPAKEVNAKCLECHAGTHPNFLRSPHAKAGLSCVSCHSIHHSKTAEDLLKAPQPKLCYQCHADVKASFSMPFHHRVNEGLIKCSDCHDVHGTFGNNNLRSTADQNKICTKCHTDVRGPFVYEHTPVKAEGCTACHTPHGSQNPRLLNMPNVDVLCNQCHSPVASHAIQGMGQGSSEKTSCIDCHTMIHGSNLSPAFIR